MAFLREASRRAPAIEGVRVYDPVPNVITRRADLERARLLVQSRSRAALQEFLRGWSATLRELAPREPRWHLDVDPIEFD